MSNKHNIKIDCEQKHADNPIPGDIWMEHFCLYFVVLKVLPNGNVVIADKDMSFKEGQVASLDKAREVTKDDFLSSIKYKSIDGFVANVYMSDVGKGWVEKWETVFGGKYISI